jgi:toxin ParE1/3/4
MRIRWHRSARADLAELVEFIANENPDAASRVVDEIHRQIALLSNYRELGRPGRVIGTRERAVVGTPFIVVYQAEADIVILRILHGARRWPQDF